MIDLQQTALIMTLATERTLVVIDEFGKGTNASDGAGLCCGVFHLHALAVAASHHRAARHAEGGPALLRALRLRACYSVPLSLVGKTVELRIVDGVVRVVHLGSTMAEHALVAPGATSIDDAHYGGPRPAPQRAPRPRTAAERAVCALGDVGVAFITGAAAAGVSTLAGELEAIAALEAAHGREALVAALERAVAFGRWRVADVRSILAAGAGVARPSRPGEALIVDLPVVAVRPLSDYAPSEAQ